MKGWLMDAYRAGSRVIVWIKTAQGDRRVPFRFNTSIFVDMKGRSIINKLGLRHGLKVMPTYMGEEKEVLEVPVPGIMNYESVVRIIEKRAKNRIALYNADIAPEQQFLYSNDLMPFTSVDIDGASITPAKLSELPVTRCSIRITVKDSTISSISIEDREFCGEERVMLNRFSEAFDTADPDVILMERAFHFLPILDARMRHHRIIPKFHRWDPSSIHSRGGKSFFSYGNIIYRDFAVRLNGRFLVDTTTVMGAECDVEAIMELCRLTGARFQQLASRSFGACFQHSLVRLLYRRGLLIPYKEKPVDIPVSMLDLLKGDAAGHRLDPAVGFHRDVAEIDFTSMFPWIIYNKNVSADTILGGGPPYEDVPGLPIRISHERKGIVPEAIKPLIDRRMEYKRNPTLLNIRRAHGLKAVLVTAYGYLRFREFKLGIASSHMAICAYAREMLLQAARLAEKRGFRVIHGIVDSLFIQKKGIKEEEVRELCEELGDLVGIPVEPEGIFRWVVFLPSINDVHRPLPSTYYGVFRNNKIKARGIELRQRSTPKFLKQFQERILEEMAQHSTKKSIVGQIPEFCSMARALIGRLDSLPAGMIKHRMRISKEQYTSDIPQRRVLSSLRRKGVTPHPGQCIEYVVARGGRIYLPEDFDARDLNADIKHYRALIERSLFNILQPFGVSRNLISDLCGSERQLDLNIYIRRIRQVLIPFDGSKARKGLSEKIVRKRLEQAGWLVWRGGLFNIVKRDDNYPNVQRKYELLCTLIDSRHPGKLEELQYLCHVHHGLPDFVAYRNTSFIFIECKLGYEQLSKRQKRCIARLQSLGFDVEIHRLAEPQTKDRLSLIDLETGSKDVLERQLCLMECG